MELLIQVYVKFIEDHHAAGLQGDQYKARLYDKDLISDDFLGESGLDAEGRAHFTVDPKQYRTEDSLLEGKPDFYVVLMKEGQPVFKTPVARNIDLTKQAGFNAKEGEWLDLGTFMIGA